MCQASQLVMVLPLTMKRENLNKKKKCWFSLNFVTFQEPCEKLAFLKIAAKAFEAEKTGVL